jgi:predicted nucleotidyltransferase component of viral defense system
MVSSIIQVIDFGIALANKLAAWNERRLVRDLYDIYFLYKMVCVVPDEETLQFRLIDS